MYSGLKGNLYLNIETELNKKNEIKAYGMETMDKGAAYSDKGKLLYR